MKERQATPGSSRDNRHHPKHEEAALSQYVFGKLPPQSIPLEEAILGALMLDREALTIISDILQPEAFYQNGHQVIYKAIMRLYERQNPVDILTVTEELRKGGDLETAGGSSYLVELTNRVASAANIEYHARIILQKYIQRQLIAAGTKIVKEGYDETSDCFDALDNAEKYLFAITQNTLSRSNTEAGRVGIEVLKIIEQNFQKSRSGIVTGTTSGLRDVDTLTGGWQDSDLIILAARPGMGKTGLALTLALNAAKAEKPVAFFSLEMANTQLVMRMISILGSVSGQKMRNGNLEDYEWQLLGEMVQQIDKLPIYLDDTPSLNVFELRAKCRRMKRQHNIGLVIVDYLQLMSLSMSGQENRAVNREQEVSGISRALKGLAKEINVPIIALSQLSRAVETRGGSKRPQLSDLRDSGAVEQDADIVTFIYRPEYYGIKEDETGQSLEGVAELIFAKHRHGDTDTIKVKYEKQFARFTSLEIEQDFFAPNVANAVNKHGSSVNNPASFGGDAAFPNQPPPYGGVKPKSRNDEDIPF